MDAKYVLMDDEYRDSLDLEYYADSEEDLIEFIIGQEKDYGWHIYPDSIRLDLEKETITYNCCKTINGDTIIKTRNYVVQTL